MPALLAFQDTKVTTNAWSERTRYLSAQAGKAATLCFPEGSQFAWQNLARVAFLHILQDKRLR
jgi:hypothetical protein